MQKFSPLLEPIFNHEVINYALRTRGARGGFGLTRTLRSRGDANQRASVRSLSLASKTKNLPIFRVPPPTPSRFLKKERFFGFGSAYRLPKSSISISNSLRAFHSAFFSPHADPRRSAIGV